jgi:hypothetical protein
MTLFNPIWRVTIGGVQYTTAILANLTIRSGRTNIYEQAQAGYTNLEIINLDQSNVAIQINNSITIELQDSTATFVPIFGGSVVEVGIAVAEVGSVDYAQRINIIALGALARLPKALTEGVLNDDFDGDQIYTILKEVLLNSWQEVPQALQWATYDPTTQWQDAENSGLGEIDQPGNYELENRGYLELRAYPRFNFNNITFELTNPEIDDSDRDDLINVFMGMPVNIANLPLNMNSGDFLGFVEGWTFSARYNQVKISMIVSPIAFSLQAMRWNDVPIVEAWNTINPTLDWINATIVA